MTTLFALFAGAGPLPAQQVPPAELTEQALSTYTEAHIALDAARDDFQRELGLTHDLQERTRLRDELAERVATILEEHEILREEYDRITTLISVDQALRERFEALMATLATSGAPGGGSG